MNQIALLEPRSSFNAFEPSARLGGQPVRIGKGSLGQPVWIGRLALDWEILIYEKEDLWEACFYKWGHHHEHTTALSFSEVRGKAKERIEILEAAVRDLSGSNGKSKNSRWGERVSTSAF